MDSSADHAQTQQKKPDGDAADQPQPQSQAKSVRWSTDLTQEIAHPEGNMPAESNPYVTSSPAASSSSKVSMETIKGMLGRWGKRAKEAAKKTEDYAGNVWQHLKTGPSVADTAMGRIAHSTKVLAEGGYEKIFKNTFETLSDERLKKSFACYLSTSAGPVVGILYLSTSKLAFCSDNPLSYQVGDRTEWSYYKWVLSLFSRWPSWEKRFYMVGSDEMFYVSRVEFVQLDNASSWEVVIPLQQLRKVSPSTSKVNRAEKYIQVVSVDNHEFWFMGFMHYDNAVKSLEEASHT